VFEVAIAACAEHVLEELGSTHLSERIRAETRHPCKRFPVREVRPSML
jgi:hypothetical protein